MGQDEQLVQADAPTPPPWTPADLNPEYWFDPADTYTTEVSGKISVWTKRAGTGTAQLSQGTAGNRPVRALDASSRRVIGFTASSDQYLTATAKFTAGTIFVVAKYTGATFSGYAGLVDASDSNTAWFVGEDGTANFYNNTGITHYRDGTQTLAAAPNSWHVYELTCSPTKNETMQVGQDSFFTDRAWNGQVGDIISFTTVLSVANRSLVRNYLGTKWGITVS